MLNIKRIREEKGLQQKDIALALHRTIACISSWETGKTEPSIDDLKNLAMILDSSIDFLVGFVDEFGNVNINKDLSPVLEQIVNLAKALKIEDQYQVLGFIQALHK